MIPTAAMLAAMLPANGRLPFHAVYVATAIASGSLVGTWMNDSGFWLFSKMGGVSELETLKSWTPVLAAVGRTSMVTTLVLARLVPLRVHPSNSPGLRAPSPVTPGLPPGAED